MALPTPSLPDGATRIVVGLSGGIDSVALCHWLVSHYQARLPIIALHVNHGLSPQANNWQAAVREFCQGLGIECICEQVAVHSAGLGVEAAARDARYSAFERHSQPGDLLALGHHLQDQAETVIFRLMRGTGIDGLAAMAECSERANLKLWRPLLHCSREDITAYAKRHQLAWVEDDSNSNLDFSRNFIRHEVLPLLTGQWPKALQQLAHTAKIAGEAKQLNQLLLAEHWPSLGERRERFGSSVAIDELVAKPPALRAALLRYWLGKRGVVPELAHLKQIDNVLEAKADASPVFELGPISVRRFAGRVYLLALPVVPEPCDFHIQTCLSDGSEVRVQGCDAPLSVRYRVEGLRAQPAGRAHSQTLKKLLQAYQVAPWLRQRLPLIYHNEQLLAVADLWVEASALERFPALGVQWLTA